MQESGKVGCGANGVRGGPPQLEQEQSLVAHAARTTQDTFDGRVHRAGYFAHPRESGVRVRWLYQRGGARNLE
jgi:hypothetical protein